VAIFWFCPNDPKRYPSYVAFAFFYYIILLMLVTCHGIDIQRSNLNPLRGTLGCDYEVRLPGQQRDGDCQVLLRTPKFVSGYPLTTQALIDAQIAPKDLIMEINIFFPNGRADNKSSLERRGRGGAVLELIEADAIAVGAKAIFAYTSHSSMKAFLEKHDFLLMDYSQCYLKILEDKSRREELPLSEIALPSDIPRKELIKMIEG
jgi:hypothetical protein